MKELIEITPILVELVGSVNVYVGTRDKTDDDVIWTHIKDFTDQTMIGTRCYGKYFSFKFVANDMDDYYKISEITGRLTLSGRR